MKKLRFVIFSLLLAMPSFPLYAQLSLGSNPQPATPQAAQMTRYGSHGVNLYTGRMTVSIPIGEYRDKDFVIPVSLEYNYNGMRPNEQAAEPGLGWMLSCGGMITREVVGFPDEEQGQIYALVGTAPSAIPVQPHDEYPFSSEEPDLEFTLLGLGNSPDNAVTTVFPGSGNAYYDASSDIYHFRMPGHSGSFYRRTDGTFAVFDTGGECGTYRVEKQNRAGSAGDGAFYYSQITVTTGDGYRYIFGSLYEDNAYTERVWPGKDHPEKRDAIIAWRLRAIVSPGGRELFFYYGDYEENRAVQGFAADRWISFDGTASSLELSGTSRYATYSPLTSIEGDGGAVVFYYSEKDTMRSGQTMVNPHIVNLSSSFATLLLDSVICNEAVTRLSYTWNSNGNPYPFLAEVHTDGIGSWRMTYEGLSEGYFPPFWTVATDHWGYLNKTNSALCNSSVVTWSTVSTLNGYQETLLGAKAPDTTAARLGLMKSLSYPTGGSTYFSYEANRYGRAVLKNPLDEYRPTDLTASGYGPGARITRIENRDSDGMVTDARTFTYGMGRLLFGPRYQIHYGGTICGVPENVFYATTGGILRQGAVQLEYPSVTETRLDGASTVWTFTDWIACPDEFPGNRVTLLRAKSGGGGLYTVGVLENIPHSGHLYNILEPLSSLQHYRGMPLSVSEYASGGTSSVQTILTTYDLNTPEYTMEYINVGDACAFSHRYGGEARALSQTTTTHYEQGSVAATTDYTYNNRGQVTDERTRSSDGDSLRTTRTYPQDYPSDVTLAAMTAANFVDYPVTEVQLRRRSGSPVWDTTAAVRYTYASFLNLLGEAFYAATSVHRRQDNGSWVTESTFLHDNEGNVIQRTDAAGTSTSYVWNSSFGVSIVVENATRQQIETCLAQSPAIPITETEAAAARLRTGLPQARVTDFDYLRYGLPTRITDPAGRTLAYAYDDNDRLVSITEAGVGLLQQFHYNTATR